MTLNIAKKIAFDERREIAADLVGQMELDVDPSLPLDNLEKNIVCVDALFDDWPEVDAIVSNRHFSAGSEHAAARRRAARDCPADDDGPRRACSTPSTAASTA